MERWTFDYVNRCGYVYVNSGRPAHATVGIDGHGFLVDVDEDGRIVGVQVLEASDPVDMLSRLAGLLEHCRLAG